jgi:hypothetical protein
MTVRGPTFIRLLARLADVEVTQSNQSLSDRLSQWLDWNQAIALSTALDGKPSRVPDDAAATVGVANDDYVRVRSSLVKAIAGDLESTGGTQRQADHDSTMEGTANEAVDYTIFRQRYLARQRAMQSATGNLRGRLRDMVARLSVDMARLAEVDAAMELALSPREQRLLAAVPALLGNHFECLRQAGQAALANPQVPLSAATAGTWLDVFRKDMQSVLLAELDVRFQPVEGLLEVLRTRQ